MNSYAAHRPSPLVVLELLKPITWFPPMWALGCGIVSSGVSPGQRWPLIVAGVLLAGPMVCGTSQAVNDWYDRHVDAINEPDRPIPSGRIPGYWGLYIAVIWTVLSLLLATLLGSWGFVAAIVGLVLAWAYSAPPIRLKRNGWWGNAACGLCYEGLPWFTGAAVMSASSIGAAKGGGYARYLEAKTVAPERGDYYLTPDGELAQAQGRWLASPDTLERLGIQPPSGDHSHQHLALRFVWLVLGR